MNTGSKAALSTGVGAAGLIVGAGLGVILTHDSEPETITEIETVTEVEEVEVETVPSACLDAIEYAEDVNMASGTVMLIMGEALQAAFDHDGETLTELTDTLETLQDERLDPALDNFREASTECEEAS